MLRKLSLNISIYITSTILTTQKSCLYTPLIGSNMHTLTIINNNYLSLVLVLRKGDGRSKEIHEAPLLCNFYGLSHVKCDLLLFSNLGVIKAFPYCGAL